MISLHPEEIREAVLDGPFVNWKHVDGPLLIWATQIHWLTYTERFQIYWNIKTVEEVASKRWPKVAALRRDYLAR